MPEPIEHNPELNARNLRLGLGLFAIFVLLFGGTIAVAFIYLALD